MASWTLLPFFSTCATLADSIFEWTDANVRVLPDSTMGFAFAFHQAWLRGVVHAVDGLESTESRRCRCEKLGTSVELTLRKQENAQMEMQSVLIDNSNNRAAGGYGTRVPINVLWSPLPRDQVWMKIFATRTSIRAMSFPWTFVSVRACHLEGWLSTPSILRSMQSLP